MNRYHYASYRSLERAQAALEDCFASGDILPGELPRIERQSTGGLIRFVITLEG